MTAPLIDFIGPRHRPRVAAVVLVAAGTALVGGGLVDTLDAWQSRERADAALQRVTRLTARPAATDERPLDPRVLAAARALAGQLATPWSELLSVLESNPVRDVALTGLEPNSEKQEMRITGEARTLEHLVTYLRFLQEQPRISRAVLVQHQTQANEPGTPVRFLVQVGWRAS